MEDMRRNGIYALVALTLIWVVLMESISWYTVLSGLVLGIICLLFFRKFIPLERIGDVCFLKFAPYPFYLIGQIYIQGFFVIKMILTGVRVDIVEAQTELKSDFLKAILMNSITLTPGSIPLELEGKTLTILNLASASDENADESLDNLRARLEKQLAKAQK